MPDSTPPVAAPVTSAPAPIAPPALDPKRLALKRQYPTSFDLRARARKVLPNFAFEYCDGGAGSDGGIERNWSALDAIEMVPRYGKLVSPPPADCELFGRKYSAPIGIAPVGGPGTVFPGAEKYLAAAAQKARVPYTLGVLSGITVEEAAKIAPDVLWFQLYRFARNDHAIGFDLAKRADAAGVQALMLTVDTPIRTVRSRETKSGITTPFRLTWRLRVDAMSSPAWMSSLARNGIPKFVNFRPYMPPGSGLVAGASFMQREGGGAFTWEEVARYRDKWKKPLLVKGILHPADAERAVSLGLDGIVVTNHGGRQVDALPAPIDVLPAIAAEVGRKATIIFDSGIRSGVDVARAVALGADAAFAGKPFLWSLGALGQRGPGHLIDVLTDDVRATLGQLGCPTVGDLRRVPIRHPGAYTAADFASRN